MLPESFTVDGVTVPITQREIARNREGGRVVGQYKAHKMSVAPNQTQADERDTVLHEVLHSLFEFAGLGKRYTAKTEESIVSELCPWLYETLRQNPALVAYLTE